MGKGRGRTWTPKDEADLRRLWCTDTPGAVARRLGRTVKATKHRAWRLALPPYQPASRVWSKEDTALALEMDSRGIKAYVIGRRLGRTRTAVVQRLLFCRGRKYPGGRKKKTQSPGDQPT